MKKKIVRRIVLITMAALLVLSMIVLGVVYYTNFQATKNNLVKISSIYESMLKNMTKDEIRERFHDSSADVARITIFDKNEKILVDNIPGMVRVDSLYDDEDITKIVAGERITRLKTDIDNNTVWMNNAFRIENPNFEDGYFLVNVGYTYDSNMYGMYFRFPTLICSFILITIIASFLTNKLIKTAVNPFEQIQESLEDINKGQYHQVTLNTKYEDINNVMREINDVSAKISNSINYLNFEQKKSEFLLENMWQGVLALSKRGKIILANDAIKDIFNYKNNILGCEMSFISDVEVLNDNIEEALSSGENKSIMATIKNKVYRVDISQIDEKWFEDFRGIALIVLFTDITEEYNSNRIRSDFFANASHELKTPLTAIKGYAELMTTFDNKEVNEKCIGEINKNAGKMLTLIQDMLKLSKLDAKIIDEEFVDIDLRAETDEVVNNLMSLAHENNITINTTGNAHILGMKKLIGEMITNIVGNAIKYNKENGSIDITIRTRGDEVQFIVKDTGIGIPKKDQGRIFERFYLPDKGRNKKVMSTGLGLAIVKHIVLEHDAKIYVDSEEGEGTTMTVVFHKINKHSLNKPKVESEDYVIDTKPKL